MCHDYDFELLRRAYLEELQRRARERSEPQRKPGSGSATPAKPATPEPAVRDREPVPA